MKRNMDAYHAAQVNALQEIQNNPGCETEDLTADPDLVAELFEAGYVKGIDRTHLEGTAFNDLRITPHGRELLAHLLIASKAKTFAQKVKELSLGEWVTLVAALGTILGLLVTLLSAL